MIKPPTIAQIKESLTQQPSVTDIAQWRLDDRAGVQKLLAAYDKRLAKAQAQMQAFEERLYFEEAAWRDGLVVAGVDEVGRGPLAGPVVAAAVVIDDQFDLVAVHDSKQLPAKLRNELDAAIKEQVVAYSFGVVDAAKIDEVNIYEASRIAMKIAIEGLAVQVDGLLIDAMTVDLDLPQEKLIKGDDRSISIGAASILAKNFRDNLMIAYSKDYPGYGFENNAGYGTAAHLAGLETLGITPIHRHSFGPVKKYLTE